MEINLHQHTILELLECQEFVSGNEINKLSNEYSCARLTVLIESLVREIMLVVTEK